MTLISFAEIRDLYGLKIDDPKVVRLLARFPDHKVGRPSGGDQYVKFRSLGFDLLFRPLAGMMGGKSKHLRVLVTAFLYRKGQDKHEQFPDPPLGISFADSREALIEKLGEPFKTSMPGGVKIGALGVMYWDLWHADGLAIHATYDPAIRTAYQLSIEPL